MVATYTNWTLSGNKKMNVWIFYDNMDILCQQEMFTLSLPIARTFHSVTPALESKGQMVGATLFAMLPPQIVQIIFFLKNTN